MFFKSNKLLGLDIGTSTIKLAELDVSRKSASLVGFAMMATPSQSVVGGDVVNPQLISEAVAGLVQELKTKRTNVAASLWGTSVIVKKISVPKMDEKLIADQIRWEAEQYIPFDINEVNIEYQLLKTARPSAETMDVLLVAARQENVMKYAELIAGSGLICSVLDVGGFALANCFQWNYPETENQVVALLNLGASVSNLVVIDQGAVTFCRDIPVGGVTYTTELQRGMSISYEEAESIKISTSNGQAAPDEAVALLKAAHESVGEEVQASLDFYANTSQGVSIQKCYYTGGSSRTLGLIDYLADKIPMPFEPLNPFRKISFANKSMSPAYVAKIQDFAAVAIGLGLRKSGDA